MSGHCAPYQHGPVLAAVPNLRHLGYFYDHVRIERLFFDGARAPEAGELPLPPHDAGHGLTFLPDAAEPFRVEPG